MDGADDGNEKGGISDMFPEPPQPSPTNASTIEKSNGTQEDLSIEAAMLQGMSTFHNNNNNSNNEYERNYTDDNNNNNNNKDLHELAAEEGFVEIRHSSPSPMTTSNEDSEENNNNTTTTNNNNNPSSLRRRGAQVRGSHSHTQSTNNNTNTSNNSNERAVEGGDDDSTTIARTNATHTPAALAKIKEHIHQFILNANELADDILLEMRDPLISSEKEIIEVPPKLSPKLLRGNLSRFKSSIQPIVGAVKYAKGIIHWDKPSESLMWLVGYTFTAYYNAFHIALLCGLLGLLTKQYFHPYEGVIIKDNDKSLFERAKVVKEVATQVQNRLGKVADMLERVTNLIRWRSPRHTAKLVGMLCMGLIAVIILPAWVWFTALKVMFGFKVLILKGVYHNFPRLRKKYKKKSLVATVPTNQEYDADTELFATHSTALPVDDDVDDLDDISMEALAAEESGGHNHHHKPRFHRVHKVVDAIKNRASGNVSSNMLGQNSSSTSNLHKSPSTTSLPTTIGGNDVTSSPSPPPPGEGTQDDDASLMDSPRSRSESMRKYARAEDDALVKLGIPATDDVVATSSGIHFLGHFRKPAWGRLYITLEHICFLPSKSKEPDATFCYHVSRFIGCKRVGLLGKSLKIDFKFKKNHEGDVDERQVGGILTPNQIIDAAQAQKHAFTNGATCTLTTSTSQYNSSKA